MNNGYYRQAKDERSLHIFPVDLSTMFTEDGKLNTRLLKRQANMINVNSSPIINPAILETKKTLTAKTDSKNTLGKEVMVGEGKAIYTEIGRITDADLVGITNVATLTAFINSRNNLVYLGSALSTFSENVIDIYYSKEDQCLVVLPELSLMGNPLPANEFYLNITGWTVAPLQIVNLQTEINFSPDTKYRALPKLKLPALTDTIAESVTAVTISSVLLQGLATYAYITEYMRTTSGGDVNMLKDMPIQIVELNIPTSDLLESDKFDHHFVIQATPSTYKLHQINDVVCQRLTFPIFF